jgi:hypothetical protein
VTTPPASQDLLTSALEYAARQWYIIPLHDVTQGHCSCGNPQCDAPGKHPRIHDWTHTASRSPAQIRQWWAQWPYANVGILTGERSGLAVLDVDPRNGGDLALEDLEQTYGPLPDTAVALSGSKGPHHYFALNGPLGKFDPGPGLNLQADGAQVVAPPSLHHSGNRYEWEASSHPDEVVLAPLPDWLRAMGEAMASSPVEGVNLPNVLPLVRLQNLQVSHRIKYLIQTGEDPDDPNRYCYPNGTPDRSRALFAVIQALLSAGHDDATIASVVMDQRYAISAKVLSQKHARNPRYWEQTKTWVAKEIARAKAKQLLLLSVSGQATRQTETPEEDNALNALFSPLPWPQLAEQAYYGLAGKIVRTIEPQTESDPVALLVRLLVMFGSAIGRTPYFPVEADRHYPNIFVCLVGPTSRGRKGTSAGHPRRLLTEIDPAWGKRVKGGLSSGEGVIWQVRDPITKKGKNSEEETVDEGVADKRLCLLETEFARGLAKTGQEGNVLSAVLRQAWDHGTLETLVSGRTKSPVNATHAHVSVIAHITVEELRRLLTETEAANGFGNRFLWVCARRSKLLPEGGMYPEQALQLLSNRLKAALFAARQVGEMRRSAEATTQWRVLYQALADGYPGLVGALLARAEAQILRLSCLYALLDSTATVKVAHLKAASALWRYCDASARYIFGTILGDPLADEICRMLRQMAPEGMTRTDINNALGRNYKSVALGQALDRLLREGHARCTVEKTSGRPVEWWFASTPVLIRTNELNEKSPSATTLNSFNSLVRHAENGTAGKCPHTQMGQENGQPVCLDCGELLVPPPSNGQPPAFTSLTASGFWCQTCGATVSFRTLNQRDGTEVDLCNTCDTEVGRKRTTAPVAPADEEEDFRDIPF